jgi:hypothetical protein
MILPLYFGSWFVVILYWIVELLTLTAVLCATCLVLLETG